MSGNFLQNHLNNRRILNSRQMRLQRQRQNSKNGELFQAEQEFQQNLKQHDRTNQDVGSLLFDQIELSSGYGTPDRSPNKSFARVSLRSDKYHTPILKGFKKQRVTFKDQFKAVGGQLVQIFIVENWKQYNQDFDEDPCCTSCFSSRRCSVF